MRLLERPFEGKRVLITGSSRGVGRAMAQKMALLGADVLLHYRKNQAGALSLAQELQACGSKTWLYAADLSDPQGLQSLIDRVLQEHSQLDFLIANAAATAFKSLLEIKAHHIQKTFQITISSFILLVNALSPLMLSGGKILAISGIDAHRYCRQHGLLGAAKAALETLVRYYAVELASRGISVHGLNPGVVDTDSVQFYLKEKYEVFLNRLEVLGISKDARSPQLIAELAAFLCRSESNLLTGQTLHADQALQFLVPAFSESL